MHPARPSIPAAIAFVLTLVATATGHAAPDAGAKASGNYNFYGHSVHHAFTSARSHVDTYQRYLSETHGVAIPDRAVAAPATNVAAPLTTETIPAAAVAAQGSVQGFVDPEIARDSGDAIADDIERIQRHVSRMREQAKSLDDKAALADLADVEKKLGEARRAHAALHEHHSADVITPSKAMELAQKVNDSLRAAHAEHDDVMRRIATPTAGR
jgi:hypothetical protein